MTYSDSNLYLGVDTSAYTTSLAAVNETGELAWEARTVLAVPDGETGLAQSTAFFQHVQNLPGLIARVPDQVWNNLKAVGVSTKPRPQAGSYMPVFTAGYAVASAIAAARRVKLWETTHQEGHIAAGAASAFNLSAARFLAIHISGGTTEILAINHTGGGRVELDLLGGTTDLHAGQFIDRVGVLLGLPFPAGQALEQLALGAGPRAASLLPSAVQGLKVSFSGVETAARRLLAQGIAPADLARAVEGCIARTVSKLAQAAIAATGLDRVLIVGGVASNRFIREEMARRLAKVAQLFWAESNWSRDNAIGVALLAREAVLGLSRTNG